MSTPTTSLRMPRQAPGVHRGPARQGAAPAAGVTAAGLGAAGLGAGLGQAFDDWTGTIVPPQVLEAFSDWLGSLFS